VVLGEDLMTLDSTRRSLAHGGAMLGLGRRAFAETGGESKS